MRKGSKKPVEIIDPEHEKFIPSKELYWPKINLPVRIEKESQIIGILIRLCDACHDMDTKTEPWASIRKDIERLK